MLLFAMAGAVGAGAVVIEVLRHGRRNQSLTTRLIVVVSVISWHSGLLLFALWRMLLFVVFKVVFVRCGRFFVVRRADVFVAVGCWGCCSWCSRCYSLWLLSICGRCSCSLCQRCSTRLIAADAVVPCRCCCFLSLMLVARCCRIRRGGLLCLLSFTISALLIKLAKAVCWVYHVDWCCFMVFQTGDSIA